MKRGMLYLGLFSLLAMAMSCGPEEHRFREEYFSNDTNGKSSDYSRDAIATNIPGLAYRTTESILLDRLSPLRGAEPTRLALTPELVSFDAASEALANGYGGYDNYDSYNGGALAADFAPQAPVIGPGYAPGVAAAVAVPVVPAVPVIPAIPVIPVEPVPIPALPALSPPVAEFLAGVRDVPPWKANYVNSYGQLPSRVATGGPFLYSYTVRR